MKHVLTIPMRLLSEANTHQHWRKKYERNKRQTNAVRLVWSSQRPAVAIPCRVHFVRVGRRYLDGDNLCYAFKNLRDTIGSLIRPGLVAGQADADGNGIEWSYGQEIGLYGIRIEIEYDEPSYKDGKALC